jgi:uncharacterized protein (TIGR02118 family)
MTRFLILYNKPDDLQAFERHYQETHVPLAKKLPELQRYTVSRSVMPVPGGEPYYLVAELDWNDRAALQRALQSPEGQAIAQDLAEHLARLSPGVRSMIFEVKAA